MVSTRGPRCKFSVGEKVLCYEPDPTKAKVLYDSKVIDVIDPRDKRSTSKRQIEYMIHFQGWNASWDRLVGEEFVLKDTDEHRGLQKSLAEQAQLQLGSYLYRKEQKKQHRLRNLSNSSSDTTRCRFRGSSDDDSSMTGGLGDAPRPVIRPPVVTAAPAASTAARGSIPLAREPPVVDDAAAIAADNASINIIGTVNNIPRTFVTFAEAEATDPAIRCSMDTVPEHDRFHLHIGDTLRAHLDLDWRLINQQQRLLALPGHQMPAATILENWVKHYSIKAWSCPAQPEQPRRRSSSARQEKREKDYERLTNGIAARMEVAESLRIYLNYTLCDHLLYEAEREQAAHLLSAEFGASFRYAPADRQTLGMLSMSSARPSAGHQHPSSQHAEASFAEESTGAVGGSAGGLDVRGDAAHAAAIAEAESTKRRLRSYKHDESSEYIIDIGVQSKATATGDKSSVVSNSSGNSSTPHSSTLTSASLSYLRSLLPLGTGISARSRDLLQTVLAFQIVPASAGGRLEPVMLWGATHLARLIVQLPQFLNLSPMADDKLKAILRHLDSFVEFLEAHPEWFGEDHYCDAAQAISRKLPAPTPNPVAADPKPSAEAATVAAASSEQTPKAMIPNAVEDVRMAVDSDSSSGLAEGAADKVEVKNSAAADSSEEKSKLGNGAPPGMSL